MICTKCHTGTAVKFGVYGTSKTQRFRCRDCGATFSERQQVGAHTLPVARIVQVFTILLEGMSIRATARITDVHKTTILKLLRTVGAHCAGLFDARVRNVRTRFVQADEAWTFVQKKQKRLTLADPEERGDQYVWLAIDSETKSVLSYRVGKRDGQNADEFIGDLRRRIAGRCQLTTDGLEGYIDAVDEHFGADVDFAQLVKNYAPPRTDGPDWFRPSHRIVSAIPTPITGDPDFARISTSHIERMNLSVRMHMRRFTRLTNAFSKKVEYLRWAVAIFVTWFNFCRVHQVLRVTPAMQAGLTDHVWTIEELLTTGPEPDQAKAA